MIIIMIIAILIVINIITNPKTANDKCPFFSFYRECEPHLECVPEEGMEDHFPLFGICEMNLSELAKEYADYKSAEKQK